MMCSCWWWFCLWTFCSVAYLASTAHVPTEMMFILYIQIIFYFSTKCFFTETGILFGFWLSNFALELSNSFRNIHCIPVYIISIWPMFCAWQIWSCRRIRTCGPCCIGLKKIWITETVRMYVKVPLYCYLTFPEVIGL